MKSPDRRAVIGFQASHEQAPPSQLLRDVVTAEAAGFEAAMFEAKVGAALADQTLLHLLGPDRRVPDLVDDCLEVTLDAHGYRWLRFDGAPNPLI